MKHVTSFAVRMAALFVFMIFMGGCASTPVRRARGMPHVFDTLSSEDQQRVLAGEIVLGDTPEIVYVAWGKPDRKSLITMHDEETEAWIYFGYHSEFVDAYPRWHPFERWYYDRYTGRYYRSRYHALDYPGPMTYRVPYEQRRVVFRNNEVVAIEQSQ